VKGDKARSSSIQASCFMQRKKSELLSVSEVLQAMFSGVWVTIAWDDWSPLGPPISVDAEGTGLRKESEFIRGTMNHPLRPARGVTTDVASHM
jgi:hypothetical protein